MPVPAAWPPPSSASRLVLMLTTAGSISAARFGVSIVADTRVIAGSETRWADPPLVTAGVPPAQRGRDAGTESAARKAERREHRGELGAASRRSEGPPRGLCRSDVLVSRTASFASFVEMTIGPNALSPFCRGGRESRPGRSCVRKMPPGSQSILVMLLIGLCEFRGSSCRSPRNGSPPGVVLASTTPSTALRMRARVDAERERRTRRYVLVHLNQERPEQRT